MLNRDEKIENEIIKPKDELIQGLYQDNLRLHQELSRQAKVIDEAEKYQKERDTIIADNKALNNKVKDLEREYKNKINTAKNKMVFFKLLLIVKIPLNYFLQYLLYNFFSTLYIFFQMFFLNV